MRSISGFVFLGFPSNIEVESVGVVGVGGAEGRKGPVPKAVKKIYERWKADDEEDWCTDQVRGYQWRTWFRSEWGPAENIQSQIHELSWEVAGEVARRLGKNVNLKVVEGAISHPCLVWEEVF